jgi:hypothetical protein
MRRPWSALGAHCKGVTNLLRFAAFGVLAQLVERNNGIVEASGSTPLHSIYYPQKFIYLLVYFPI